MNEDSFEFKHSPEVIPKRVEVVLEALEAELGELADFQMNLSEFDSTNSFAINEMEEEVLAAHLNKFLKQIRDGVDLSDHLMFRAILTRSVEIRNLQESSDTAESL